MQPIYETGIKPAITELQVDAEYVDLPVFELVTHTMMNRLHGQPVPFLVTARKNFNYIDKVYR